MPNFAIIGCEPSTGRIALGMRAVAQMDHPVIDRVYPSALPYRALLFDPRHQSYRLAPASEKTEFEDVVHPKPFGERRTRWVRPLWIGELP